MKDVFGIVGTTQAGSFRVESVVAEGGFAVVYRAQHGAFRAPVALKCLKVPEEMTSEARHHFLDKFREEGELLFRLSAHIPAVVRPLHVDVLELPSDRFVPFLALEWLDGDGLDVIIRRRYEQGQPPITLEKLIPFLTPVAHGLACAHRFPGADGTLAIIHRDLKPENIFVSQSQGGEVVKILDYGIARTRSASTLYAGRVTQGGTFDAFTPGYAAPEQWLPKRYGQTGPWTDVWGLALTMVEALAGKPPIVGDVSAMMGTTVDEALRPTPRAEGVDVSDEVEAIFARALLVDPRARTQTIEEFWSELERAIGLDPTLTVPDTPEDSLRPLRIKPLPPTGIGASARRSPAAASIPVRQPLAVEEPSPDPARPVARSGPRNVAPDRSSPTPPHSADHARRSSTPGMPAAGPASGPARRSSVAGMPAVRPISEPSRSSSSPGLPAASAARRNSVPGMPAVNAGSDPARRNSVPGMPAVGAPPGLARRSSVASMPAAHPASGPARRSSVASMPAVQAPVSQSPTPSRRPLVPAGRGSRTSEPPLQLDSIPPLQEDVMPSEPAPRARVSTPPGPALPIDLEYAPPRPAGQAWPTSERSAGASLVARLRLPFGLVAIGIAIGVMENLYFRQFGESISLGPIRALWIAVPAALAGVVLGSVRLFSRSG